MRVTQVQFPMEVIPTDLPISSLCQANSALNPSDSSTIRVAPIDHYWWYDQRLGKYDPRSLGRTRVDLFNGTSGQVCTINFLYKLFKKTSLANKIDITDELF